MPPPPSPCRPRARISTGMFGASRAQHRARDEQAERNDDHGAAAIDVAQRAEHRRHRGRGQQIGRDHPGQIGDVLELAADGRQRGRDDGLVERGQEHRQHQAHQDGADLALGQRRRRRERRRIADIDDLGRDVRQLARRCRRAMSSWSAGSRLCRSNLFMSDVIFLLRDAKPRDGIAICAAHLERQIRPRGSGCAHGCIPRGHHRNRVIDQLRSEFRQAFGRFFSRARFGNSAGHCTM